MNFFETFAAVILALYVYNNSGAIRISFAPVLELVFVAIGVLLVLSIPLSMLWALIYVAVEYNEYWYGKLAAGGAMFIGYIFGSMILSYIHGFLLKLKPYRWLTGNYVEATEDPKTDKAA